MPGDGGASRPLPVALENSDYEFVLFLHQEILPVAGRLQAPSAWFSFTLTGRPLAKREGRVATAVRIKSTRKSDLTAGDSGGGGRVVGPTAGAVGACTPPRKGAVFRIEIVQTKRFDFW